MKVKLKAWRKGAALSDYFDSPIAPFIGMEIETRGGLLLKVSAVIVQVGGGVIAEVGEVPEATARFLLEQDGWTWVE